MNTAGRRSPAAALGAPARAWAARPASTCPTSCRGAFRPPAGVTAATRSSCAARSARSRRTRRSRRACAASWTGPGRWATTSTSPSGQGDIAANPLQMAVAYAAVANGGEVLRPAARTADRGLLGPRAPAARGPDRAPGRTSRKPTARRSSTASTARRTSRAAPRPRSSRASRSRSPARPAPRRRALGRADQSWYVALAPYPNPKYVVAVTDEAGGFGADTAAPDGAADPRRAVQRRREPAGRGRETLPTDGRLRLLTGQGLPRRRRPACCGSTR